MTTNRKPRVALAVALVTVLTAAFAALGGVGVAQSAISAFQYQYGKKVTVCHKGKKTITISRAALPAHLKHGDTVGTCAQAAKAKKAKAAKIKAAKAKAAKAKASKAKAKGRKAEQPTIEAVSATETSAPGKGKGKGQGKRK